MNRVLAIHRGGSWNARWIEHCQDHGIPHRVVDCFASDIMVQLRDCWGLMWLFRHTDPQEMLLAQSVLNSAAAAGLRVFPDHHTCWHYDDKLAQKYLFEALGLPAPPAWAFFDRRSALDFVAGCPLPIVAKLRRGAGSYNVRLLRSRSAARRYVRRMFGRGFSPMPALLADAGNKLRVAAAGGRWKGIVARLRKAPRFFRMVVRGRQIFGREKGYAYFQKFLPGNSCDIRISVVGSRAWGFRRVVRKNDFRASGSGVIDYDTSQIPLELVAESFRATDALGMQSACFDWVRDPELGYRFVEVSMGFVDQAVRDCDGYWDRELTWRAGHVYPSIAVLEDMLAAAAIGGRSISACGAAGQDGGPA